MCDLFSDLPTEMANWRPIDRAVFERLIVASAPERVEDLREIWKNYDPEFVLVPDSPGIKPSSKGKVVKFDDKSMRILWVLAHSAWRIFVCHSPHVLLMIATGDPIDRDMMKKDPGFAEAVAAFEGFLYLMRDAVKAESADEIAWPQDLADPNTDRSTLPADQHAVFDLVDIATAYVFLHEIRHVMFAKDKNAPARGADEEIVCDTFARDFLLARINTYAESAPWSAELILMKRAMAVALGAFFVYEVTASEIRSGTDDYPPFADRFETLIGQAGATNDSDFWVFAATLLLASLRRLDPRASIKANAPDELCRNLIAAIRKATPDV
jgi:hypothetical protein